MGLLDELIEKFNEACMEANDAANQALAFVNAVNAASSQALH